METGKNADKVVMKVIFCNVYEPSEIVDSLIG